MTTENINVPDEDAFVKAGADAVRDAAYEMYKASGFADVTGESPLPTYVTYVETKHIDVKQYHQNSRMRKRVGKGRAKARKVHFKEDRTTGFYSWLRKHFTFKFVENHNKPIPTFMNEWVKNAGQDAPPKAD